MDQALVDVFEQARKVVADADRKIAEEEERRRENERERLMQQLAARIEDAFDFTSKEKLELETRLDVQDGIAVLEFVVRRARAIFLLFPNESNTWTLQMIEDGHQPHVLGEFQGGTKAEQGSRRLAAARIVTMVGNWVQNVKGAQVVTNMKLPTRRYEEDEPKPERTYGTMGKFLGVGN
jgi:DNA-binding protein H-NS